MKYLLRRYRRWYFNNRFLLKYLSRPFCIVLFLPTDFKILIFAIFLIVFLTPQVPKNNKILEAFHSERLLAYYIDEKNFIIRFSWFFVVLFLTLAFFDLLY